jgi:hypothetical protein
MMMMIIIIITLINEQRRGNAQSHGTTQTNHTVHFTIPLTVLTFSTEHNVTYTADSNCRMAATVATV